MKTCSQCTKLTQANDSFCQECGAPTTAPDPMLHKNLLGQYRVIRRIGEGGFGAVYEAEQASMQRKIAIKTLHPHLARREAIIARFRREGLATSKLQHPAAVKVYNLGETEEHIPWLSMEFVEGVSLEERLTQGPLSIQDCLRIILPICEVLEEAHNKGIYHRDLKPQNIMLPFDTSAPPCKLLDFGLASLLEGDAITAEGVVSGTPAYMAPEQWKGLSLTDARSDIYSLGLILYKCLSGVLPFQADSMPQWAIKHSEATPTPLHEANPNIPRALSDVVMKCLAKDPIDRFQSARELREGLSHLTRGSEAAPSPSQAAHRNDGQTRPPWASVPPSSHPSSLASIPSSSGASSVILGQGQRPRPGDPSESQNPGWTSGSSPKVTDGSSPKVTDGGENKPQTMHLIPPMQKSTIKILRVAVLGVLFVAIVSVGLFALMRGPALDPNVAIKEAARLTEIGSYDEALAVVEQIKAVDPSFAKAYLVEGSIYQFKSEKSLDNKDTQAFIELEKACLAYTKYRQLSPSTPEAPHLPALMQEVGVLVKACQFP